MFLSTGEISLADKMTEIGKRPRAGQEVRLVDIPADAGAGHGIFENLHGAASAGEFAEQLKRATLDFYGMPIREYLRDLVLGYEYQPAGVAGAVRSQRDDFIAQHCPKDASGQVRSVCGRFGLVAAAGEFASNLEITGWPDGEATRATVICFKAWLDQRGTTGDHDIEAGIRQVIGYIEQYGGSRFEQVYDESEHEVTNRVGFRRLSIPDGNPSNRAWEYFVLPDAFARELAKGYDAEAIKLAMIKRGMIIPQSGRTSSAVRFGRHGKIRVLRLARGIIGAEPEKHRLDEVTSDSSAADILAEFDAAADHDRYFSSDDTLFAFDRDTVRMN